MLSAVSASSFGYFFAAHFVIICVLLLVYYVRVKRARRNMTIKNVLGQVVIFVSSFFSFADYRLDQADFQDVIYYTVIILNSKT